ncbi:hypothetical protein PoB_006101800 [Plakobranchus ocellatus]|uniref:Uncharacterized protein n=1 Tax=Plakobranchus ocellatus TaxID=259542 RepID=A0AAV4CRH2_9GAST|nr:hypothetical protein PoB_006101800 [Plakobranchus ocellatus]
MAPKRKINPLKYGTATLCNHESILAKRSTSELEKGGLHIRRVSSSSGCSSHQYCSMYSTGSNSSAAFCTPPAPVKNTASYTPPAPVNNAAFSTLPAALNNIAPGTPLVPVKNTAPYTPPAAVKNVVPNVPVTPVKNVASHAGTPSLVITTTATEVVTRGHR